MEPLARPIPTAALMLDASGRLETDVTCRKCGYNLRGLLPDGVCPECATAVGRSLHGDLLRFCDPDWVQKLASGMNWIVAGIVATVALSCAGGGLAGALSIWRPGDFVLPMIAAQFIGAMILFVGYWRVTSPDPGRVQTENQLAARRLVRGTQIISLATIPLTPVLGASSTLIRATITIARTIVWIVGLLALSIYARQLALRIPDDKLARSTRIVMWGFTLVAALTAASTVAGAILLASVKPAAVFPTTMTAAPPGGRARITLPSGSRTLTTNVAIPIPVPPPPGLAGLGALFGFAGCGVGVAALVFGVWSLRLIDRYRKALNEAANLARRTWAAQVRTPS